MNHVVMSTIFNLYKQSPVSTFQYCQVRILQFRQVSSIQVSYLVIVQIYVFHSHSIHHVSITVMNSLFNAFSLFQVMFRRTGEFPRQFSSIQSHQISMLLSLQISSRLIECSEISIPVKFSVFPILQSPI